MINKTHRTVFAIYIFALFFSAICVCGNQYMKQTFKIHVVQTVHVRLFTVQDQLEEVLDLVLANQRYVLAERHAQRKFLVHSLHSLNSLISDTFSSTSSNLDGWFTLIRRLVPIVVTSDSIMR